MTMRLAVLILAAMTAAGVTAEELSLWAVGATRKVAPEDPVESANRAFSSSRSELYLAAARGENEALQLVVRGGDADRSGLTMTVSALEGTAGVIPASAVSLAREAYFEVSEVSRVAGHPVLGSTGPTPDALIPFVDPYGSGLPVGAPFTVEARRNQPVWLSVDVPVTAAEGLYRGLVVLVDQASGEELIALDLVLVVWPLTLPDEPSLATWYNIDNTVVAEYHAGISLDQLMATYYGELARRRLAAGYWFYRQPQYSEASGFDWNTDNVGDLWSEWLDHQHMSTTGGVPIFNDDLTAYRIDSPGGGAYVAADLSADSEFTTRAKRYFARLWDDLAARGWLSKTVIYMEDDLGAVSDEPYNEGEDAYDRVRAWAEVLHNPDSDDPSKRFRYLVAGDSIVPMAPYSDLRGVCDIWDMYMDEVDLNSDVYRQRLIDHPEEELWIVPNSYVDFIDYPALYHRSLGWFAYKHGATGIEQWDVLAWYDADENLVDPWRPGTLTPVWGWGGGGLMWPGVNIENRGVNIDGPLSSVRLELNRQSLEDYEYLAALERAGHGDVAEALALSCVPGLLVEGLEIDPGRYERARELAARLLGPTPPALVVVTGVVNDEGGQPVAGAVVGNGTLAAATGEDGRFRLPVPAGVQVINVEARDRLPKAVTVDLRGSGTGVIFLTLPARARTAEGMFRSFENASDLWQDADGATISQATDHVSDGGSAMSVIFLEAGESSSVAVEELEVRNWASADRFELDAYVDSPYQTELDLVFYDETWEAHTELVILRPREWVTVRVPIAAMVVNTGAMESIEIDAAVAGKGDRRIIFDHLRLVTFTESDEVAPGAPELVSASLSDGGVEVAWNPPMFDRDGGELTGLARFEILEGGAAVGPWTVVNQFEEVVASPFLHRVTTDGGERWYAIRAVDQAGNLGPESEAVTVDSRRGGPRRPSRRVSAGGGRVGQP